MLSISTSYNLSFGKEFNENRENEFQRSNCMFCAFGLDLSLHCPVQETYFGTSDRGSFDYKHADIGVSIPIRPGHIINYQKLHKDLTAMFYLVQCCAPIYQPFLASFVVLFCIWKLAQFLIDQTMWFRQSEIEFFWIRNFFGLGLTLRIFFNPFPNNKFQTL